MGHDDKATPRIPPSRHAGPTGFDEELPTELKPQILGFDDFTDDVHTVARKPLSEREMAGNPILLVPNPEHFAAADGIVTIGHRPLEPLSASDHHPLATEPTGPGRNKRPKRATTRIHWWWVILMSVLLLMFGMVSLTVVVVVLIEVLT
jgi:hypothetical protein